MFGRPSSHWVRMVLSGRDDPEGRGWQIGVFEAEAAAPEGWWETVQALAEGRRNLWTATETDAQTGRVWVAYKSENGTDRLEEDELWSQWVQTLEAELLVPVSVGISRGTEGWLDWPRRRQEAEETLRIGKLVRPGQRVYRYDDVLWERLLTTLPPEPAAAFCRDVLGDVLERYTFTEETVWAMISHHLNVSEAARALFIHRNTLLYRLDKILEATGLDVRQFDGAMKLHTAILLRRIGRIARDSRPEGSPILWEMADDESVRSWYHRRQMD